MSATGQPSPPPGWYPDPQGQGAERWWDGTQWTANQRPVGVVVGPRPMSPSDEKTWAVLAHASALVASFFALAFLGPLVVYLIKKDESPVVRAHAVAALNFQLSWLLWGLILGLATVILLFVLVGVVLLPVLFIGAVAWFVLVIIASVKAGNGEPPMKYPLTIDFVK
ncbi:MAG: DUF4870 domain-containing protein [Solirubrobacteraceae bacterium]|nr:DUF4870 domain-containing protein [Solirubrobacteraceae bacterium]